MNTPEELRADARRLREHAAELVEDNPTAADYHARRADWCEYLARKSAEDRRAEGGGS